MRYVETFDDGPGGWYGWISNAAGPKTTGDPGRLRDQPQPVVDRLQPRPARRGVPAPAVHAEYPRQARRAPARGGRGEPFRPGRLPHRFYPGPHHAAPQGRGGGQGRAAPAALPGGAGRDLLRLAADRPAVPRHARLERADRHRGPRSGAVDLPGLTARPDGLLRRNPAGGGAGRREHRHPAGAASARRRADGSAGGRPAPPAAGAGLSRSGARGCPKGMCGWTRCGSNSHDKDVRRSGHGNQDQTACADWPSRRRSASERLLRSPTAGKRRSNP